MALVLPLNLPVRRVPAPLLAGVLSFIPLMHFTVRYMVHLFPGMGESYDDEFDQQFTDLSDAIEFLHSIQYHFTREWTDLTDGIEYHKFQQLIDARLLFSSAPAC